ncbi:MAG: hypothetical protein PHI56_06460 [Victivallaceae bacterium]|nr:hypothetical protein [Victivallaceae bacterium]MDD3703611.1 hypothetical protein [Victivallaceae bacterium]MDD5663056.1 hypothetical protein [Victivallaceae bacterium]
MIIRKIVVKPRHRRSAAVKQDNSYRPCVTAAAKTLIFADKQQIFLRQTPSSDDFSTRYMTILPVLRLRAPTS